jgi:phospholipase/carboxylesterase
MKKTKTIQTPNFIIKISIPPAMEALRVGLMLHGWTGDENSMWVFTNQLDDDWLLISPRAPYSSNYSDLGGFSWIDKSIDQWPQFTDFLPAVDMLHTDLFELESLYPSADFNNIAVFGFSQGAAISFVYSILHDIQISKLGMLSGFIPDNSEGFIKKSNSLPIEVFIGHGTEDIIVPVEKAQEANSLFMETGHTPHLCLSDVGHRLGSDCFKSFAEFMNRR